MKIIGNMTQKDTISGEITYLAVKIHFNYVGLSLSEEQGCDAEVYFQADDCKKIIKLLQGALDNLPED